MGINLTELRKAAARFRANVVFYVETMFGVTPDKWQKEVLVAYGRGDRQISVRSCHGPGKTAVLAWIATHHIHTKFDSKAILTAPTSSQLNDALIPEVKKWIKRMPDDVQELFNVKQDRIEMVYAPETNFISARTSRAEQPDALQGVHAENVLLIGDEASGIPEQVFEAAGGSMSSANAQMILAGNPVRATGYFYDTHTRLRESWTTFRVSHTDSPRVSDEYVEEIALRYGRDSNTFRVRCLGEFPLGDDDTVIPVELVDSAIGRDIRSDPTSTIVWGLDVARFGSDRTALCKRNRREVLEPVRIFGQFDGMQVAGFVKAEWDSTPTERRPVQINVDSIGVGGPVADRLRQLGLPAVDVNVSEVPALKGNHYRLRDELWFQAKEWLAGRDVRLPRDKTLAEELTTPRFKYWQNGQLKVESKDELKKRGVRSPDAADAFVLTFANDATTAMGYSPSPWGERITRAIRRLA